MYIKSLYRLYSVGGEKRNYFKIRYVKIFSVSSDWLKIPRRAALMKIKYI